LGRDLALAVRTRAVYAASMEMKDRVVVVTGGGSGIGAALCRAFLREGARAVIAADLREGGAPSGAVGKRCDVTREDEVTALVREVEAQHGRLDVLCSNAGVLTPGWDVREADFSVWEQDYRVNVLAHAIAAKAALPGMIARGEGYLLQTASAAGLLAAPESAVYTMTKHAAVGLSEHLAYSYRRYGVRVSALCPMAVQTPMLEEVDEKGASAGLDGILSADAVAEAAIAGMREERFLILPHATVGDYWAKKASRHARWLSQMEKLQAQFTDAGSDLPSSGVR
jgi:NAD(P)-dependent dehydrogenase (short-subunit alcohol dehydrogenase family)